MVPIYKPEPGTNGLLVMINPRLAYSTDKLVRGMSLMVLFYSGISLPINICNLMHIYNQYNARC